MEPSHARADLMRMPLSSRILFSVAAVGLPIGAHLADVNETHLFNPRWPPHAHFHNAQTLAMAILLGVLTIAFAWRATTDRTTAILATTAFSGLYWVSQGLAILYPETAFFDPEFDVPANYWLGLPIQMHFQAVFMAVTIAAAWLAYRPKAPWREHRT